MPIDTDSMNAVFMTDHGSSRVTSSRARRGPTGRAWTDGAAGAGAETGLVAAAATPEPSRESSGADGSNPVAAGRAPAGGTATPPGGAAAGLGAAGFVAGGLAAAGWGSTVVGAGVFGATWGAAFAAGFVTGIGAVDPAREAPALEAVPSVSTEPAP
jgi:hypothetical protein